MASFAIRFDLRNPPIGGTTMTERYRAAIDMTRWADDRGFVSVAVHEHHGSPDGYLSSPLTMAAAMAATTRSIRIAIAAIVAPLHDPLRLAEDIAAVDRLSEGRLSVVLANGYVAREFAMFGCPMSERARRTTEAVETLRKAWTGEPFDFRGRTAQVTPTPHQPGGPPIVLGGSTVAAALRAARIADGFSPSTAEVWPAYRDEMIRLGRRDPGDHPGGGTGFFHLAWDKEKAWEAVAPYALHEVNSYGTWMAEAGLSRVGGYVPVADTDALRVTGQYRVITPDEMTAELTTMGRAAAAVFHPLMGGIPPELAWESLHLFETEVLPRV
jgi:alkanesulfonate monooxygenase SsuD/methylene tetrahydromethanopterin reductase-like flavin-dependent oxidoreductase (luciferase family)